MHAFSLQGLRRHAGMWCRCLYKFSLLKLVLSEFFKGKIVVTVLLVPALGDNWRDNRDDDDDDDDDDGV